MENRNWFRKLDTSWTCNRIMGEEFNCCRPHFIIDMEQSAVKIKTYYCGRYLGTEIVESENDVDGLIQALVEARDIVFPN